MCSIQGNQLPLLEQNGALKNQSLYPIRVRSIESNH